MKPENEISAHNIRLLRQMEGLTQADFGKKYQINKKSIWAYEKGNAKPKPQFLLELSRGVGIAPDILITVKLKTDRTGKIINLPSKELQVQKIRAELKSLVDSYKNATEQFFKGILKINERLDMIEKQVKKQGVPKKLPGVTK